MNDSLIKDYLTFFKNEKVDLRNEGINEKLSQLEYDVNELLRNKRTSNPKPFTY